MHFIVLGAVVLLLHVDDIVADVRGTEFIKFKSTQNLYNIRPAAAALAAPDASVQWQRCI